MYEPPWRAKSLSKRINFKFVPGVSHIKCYLELACSPRINEQVEDQLDKEEEERSRAQHKRIKYLFIPESSIANGNSVMIGCDRCDRQPQLVATGTPEVAIC